MRISNLGSECGIFYLNSGSFAGWRRSVSDLFSRKLLRRDAVQTKTKPSQLLHLASPCFAVGCIRLYTCHDVWATKGVEILRKRRQTHYKAAHGKETINGVYQCNKIDVVGVGYMGLVDTTVNELATAPFPSCQAYMFELFKGPTFSLFLLARCFHPGSWDEDGELRILNMVEHAAGATIWGALVI